MMGCTFVEVGVPFVAITLRLTDFEQDDTKPVVVMFQDNVVGKHFTITCDILVDLELCKVNASAVGQAMKHWNDHLGIWVKAHEGSVVDLTHSKIGNNIFLRLQRSLTTMDFRIC